MSNENVRKLLKFLHCEDVAAPTASAARDATTTEFGLDSVAELKRQLASDPDRVMSTVEEILEGPPSREEFELVLRRAEVALRRPEATLTMLEAGLGEDRPPFELPPEHQFPGYDPLSIPIWPAKTTFETVADAPAWAINASLAVIESLIIPKPEFPRHSASRPFDYPLAERNGSTTVALFSDWGTGYYHSRYIARHLEALEPAQALHLGDVYYAGRGREFNEYFTPLLAPLVASTPFYALNANHEMMSRGGPYFAYLWKKHEEGGSGGRVAQPQEGSYFCLANDHYQVLGLDTAFFKNGRVQDGQLKAWISDRLARGRTQQKVNILLSQNEPYGPVRGEAPGPRPLLTEDLRDVAHQIDLWFWGDEHYASLYAPSDAAPFIGSCIGHGGYPYTRKEGPGDVASGVAGVEVAWVESEPRFPAELDLRPTRGNNGFCLLTLEPDRILLQYIDWRRRTRKELSFPVQQGRITF